MPSINLSILADQQRRRLRHKGCALSGGVRGPAQPGTQLQTLISTAYFRDDLGGVRNGLETEKSICESAFRHSFLSLVTQGGYCHWEIYLECNFFGAP